MRPPHYRAILLFFLGIALPCGTVFGLDPLSETGGGGRADTDCYATFKSTLNIPPGRPKHVKCVDGDPACDVDGVVNGECSFSVAVCANSSFDAARCNSTGIEALTVLHADDNGTDPGFDPDLQALQAEVDAAIHPPTMAIDICSAASNIRVRIKGPFGKPLRAHDSCRRNVKIVALSTLPSPLIGASDSDRLRLICLPADDDALGCDAQHLFGGTFDRLQRQIFSQSCAVATCHDSESYLNAGDLLLESGASYLNLVGQMPNKPDAAGLGWLRVTAGDATTSFIYHKITDDLDAAPDLGLRMPRPPGRPMLHPSLREVIRLWIEAGAPETNWVPDTF